MPHIQMFHSLLKTSFFIFTSAIALRVAAFDFNPLNLSTEFETKMNSQAILQTTKYFAEGLRVKKNELFTSAQLEKLFVDKGYRLRQKDQLILANDFAWSDAQACSNAVNTALPADSQCLTWKNKDDSAYLLVLSQNQIYKTFQLEPITETESALTDPVLVAQYRNQEPLMQTELKLGQIPTACLNAVVAIEDNDFLDHSGVSVSGLGRAILKNIVTLRKAQGGSTITQQLVKNYFLTPEKTYTRKAKEIFMALKLESQWSKDQILETYLNVIYMGQNGAFQVRGYGAASQYYFNKNIERLNLSECALLAAIINNPGQNNPWKNSAKATKRRELVLFKMRELQLITETEQKEALKFALPTESKNLANETAPYYFEAVKSQAQNWGIPIEGTTFFTHLNLEHQAQAQKALKEQLEKLTTQKTKISKLKAEGVELQGVLLSAQNSDASVTAFVGGQSFKISQFNRALYSQRQIGSLIKPFIYWQALQDEKINLKPDSYLSDTPWSWTFDKKTWKPENYDKKFRGEVPLYYSLKQSLNIPTAQLAQKITLPQLITLAHDVGLTSEIEELPASSLGASQHTPLEVLQAYTSLARFGDFKALTFFSKATTADGKTINAPETQHLIGKKEKAAEIVSILQEALQSGTGQAIGQARFAWPAAGKTGTTSQNKDVWFAGFTPSTTSVVWLGYDKNQSTQLTGGSGAAPVWLQFMNQILKKEAPSDFTWPENTEKKVIRSEIDQKDITLIFSKD